MLYQPSYPQPYLSDIDATLANDFTCNVNAEGGTQVVAYNLAINDMSGNSIYTTGKQTLTTALYGGQTLTVSVPNTSGMSNGIDYVWNITVYEDTPSIWVTTGKVQSTGISTTTNVCGIASYLISVGQYIQIGTEIRQITAYDSTSGLITVGTAFSSVPSAGKVYTIYTNSVKSMDFYFQARTTPVLTLTSVPSTITNKSYTFAATYTQAENVQWKYYQWTFYNYRGKAIKVSDEATSGLITYTFDGFIDNTTYGVSITIENQDGVVLTTPISYFLVDYAAPSLTNIPTVTNLCESDALQVEWAKLLINTGVAEGTVTTPYYTLVPDVPYTGGSSVQINSNADIYWDVGSATALVNVPYESTSYLYWTTNDTGFSGMIYEQSGVYSNLVAVSPTAPTTCTTGDRYYNLSDDLIYTAIDTNTWGVTGETPDATLIYYDTATSQTYIYNGTEIETTTYPLPTYKVWYSDYLFYYEINNGATNISGSVDVFGVTFEWLLHPTTTPTANVVYTWKDTESWADAYYWTEGASASPLTEYWYKITLLPTGIQVVKVAK